jgi:hypothetical protein
MRHVSYGLFGSLNQTELTSRLNSACHRPHPEEELSGR